MDLLKCPLCGNEYSPSYKTCPFCEEDEGQIIKRRAAKRHITTRQKTQSARGGMIVVLMLVLALFGWYLFGGKTPGGEKTPASSVTDTAEPAQSGQEGSGEDGAGDAATDGQPSGEGDAETPAVHVDASALGIKTNVSGILPKDPMTGYYDCSLKRTDSIRLIVTGTDVEVSGWKSENTSIVSVDDEGRLTFAGKGTTNVTATVGDATVTCIVRVR